MLVVIRFTLGPLQRNRCGNIWALRHRYAPPMPTIILLAEGKVTEEVLQGLQVIVKGKVKYLLPVGR